MKEYRITPEHVKSYVKRNNNKALNLIILGISLFVVAFLYGNKDVLTTETIQVFIFSLLFTIALTGVIYWNNNKLIHLRAENFVLILNETSITRKVDLDNEPRMNFLNKYVYEQAKHTSSEFNATIKFDQLKSITYRKGDLLIRAKKTNEFFGKNIILIPKEINGFREIEATIKSKLQ